MSEPPFLPAQWCLFLDRFTTKTMKMATTVKTRPPIMPDKTVTKGTVAGTKNQF